MIVYGYTNPRDGYSASFNKEATRNIMCRSVPDVHLWEHEIPDEVVAPPAENTDPPITYGSVIQAEVHASAMSGPVSMVLARIGDSEFPWVGLDPRTDSTNAWAPSVIKSWKPLHTNPSADVLSQFLFQTQGYLMQEEEADSLVAFIQQEMTK
jgi:hypothetical protein